MRSMLLVLALALGCVAPARALVASPRPSPADSHVDPCIVTCPAGDSVFVVIARDASANPLGSLETVLDLCACPGVQLAPVAAGGPYWIDGCTVRTLTDIDGVARFPLAAGGLCSGTTIRVFCANVLFRNLTSVASFDQDGNLVVDGADLALVDAKRGTTDPTADFDCDGLVGDTDTAIAAAHAGHYHASIVGVSQDSGIGFGARPAPNPARGAVEFVVRVPVRDRARLSVHDLAGRRLAVVHDRELEPGVHRVAWSGRDLSGRPVAAGLYFYRLTLGDQRAQGLLVIAR